MTRIHPWALGISITISAFFVTVVSVALYFGTQPVDMVTSDYYTNDLQYQKKIDVIRRTEKLASKPSIRYDEASSDCVVSFSDTLHSTAKTGSIFFYRTNDSRCDFSKSLNVSHAGAQRISMQNLPKGIWIVKLEWSEDGKSYYVEERIFTR